RAGGWNRRRSCVETLRECGDVRHPERKRDEGEEVEPEIIQRNTDGENRNEPECLSARTRLCLPMSAFDEVLFGHFHPVCDWSWLFYFKSDLCPSVPSVDQTLLPDRGSIQSVQR